MAVAPNDPNDPNDANTPHTPGPHPPGPHPRATSVAAVDVSADPAAWLPAACEALAADGAVLLTGTGLAEPARDVGARMLAEVPLLMEHHDALMAYDDGHMRHRPPGGLDGHVTSFLGHPAVLALCGASLQAPRVISYHGHTVLPGSSPQPVHADWEPLWPHPGLTHPPFMLAVNIALVDTGDDNGSIEVWPGTHVLASPEVYRHGSLCVREELLAGRRAVRPPERVAMRPGDVLVRDVRLWHRGTRNTSGTARPMLWLLLAAPWLRAEPSVLLEAGVRGEVEALPVEVAAEYARHPVGALSGGDAE
ncbi:phytanoyl-CoA dioxygenase family protein [Nonomuraea indica]|uniref:phytanoyl-CoA dioxygenase family protein n=1 Tax=Nonomuraea indica TaxID=1581193 RepID=UPI000C795801|nr:phytanoyl-CoA dioxygenase family protein [Nonomuraea indica]